MEDKEADHIFSAYKLTGMAKIPGVIDFISLLIDCNCKFILFAHHV